MSLAGAMAALVLQAGDPTGALHAIITDSLPDCRQPRGDEIVVCARGRADPPWRYRTIDGDPGTRFDPAGDVDSVSRERHRLMEGGEAGIGSCSPVGAGGFTGCVIQDWRHNQQQHGN